MMQMYGTESIQPKEIEADECKYIHWATFENEPL